MAEARWSPRDTLNIRRIADIDVSPDGAWVAFTITQAVMTSEKSSYLSQVYLAGAGMTDLVSYALGHDSPDFVPSHFGGEVWEVKDLLLDRSPVVHADRVSTPTLLLHGEHDQRVPIWQGYEFYHALNRRGIPTQMVVYPRTGHVPSEPKLLLDVMNRILAWLQ